MHTVPTVPMEPAPEASTRPERSPKLTRSVIEELVRSGKRLLVQGGMGIHASDGLAGKVASALGRRFVTVGTVSAVLKSTEELRAELRRARTEAPGGFIGVNLMAALNKHDFELLTRTALEEGVSFIVQGAGISREIIRWCRDAGTPFAGIVSSGRLAAMYEKWGADFLVAEGAEAGGHIGDINHPLPTLLQEVLAHTSLPVVAAGGIDARDLGRYFAQGAAGVQLASRFIACSDGDSHPVFKQMHLGKSPEDITLITSCVKGMKARAVRNAFTDALAAGKAFPPKAKHKHFGMEGYMGRRKACIDCLAEPLCLCRASDYKESFCITDALLAAVKGDAEKGLFYTGQSITRLPEKSVDELKTAHELIAGLEAELEVWEAKQ
jgi:nitronate monooxygenase